MTRLCLALIRKRTNTNMQESACPREAFSYRLRVLRQDWNWTWNPLFLHRRRDPPPLTRSWWQTGHPSLPSPPIIAKPRTHLSVVWRACRLASRERDERENEIYGEPNSTPIRRTPTPLPVLQKGRKYIKTIKTIKSEIHCESHSAPIRTPSGPLPVLCSLRQLRRERVRYMVNPTQPNPP